MIDLDRGGPNPGAAWPQALCCALGPALAQLLARADVALSVKELAGGTHVHVNAPMAVLLGRSIDEVLGHTDAQLLDPAPWASLRNSELAALARSEPTGGELKLDIAGAQPRVHRLAHDHGGRQGRAGADAPGQPVDRHHAGAAPRSAAAPGADRSSSSSSAPTTSCGASMQDGALRDARHRAGHAGALRRPAAPRGRPVDARAPRVRAGRDRHRSADRLGHRAAAMPPSCACSRRSAGCCAATPARWTRRAAGRKTASRCCCRASDWPPRIRAWSSCAASARRRSSCSTAASSASPCRWAWPAFRTPRSTREDLLQACDEALDQAQRRGGNHVALASIRFESP